MLIKLLDDSISKIIIFNINAGSGKKSIIVSEFLRFRKRNPNKKRHRPGLAILLAGALAVAGCAEGQWPDEKNAEARAEKTGCNLETANSKIKGNSACVEYEGDTRTIKLLTLKNKVFARVNQECSGKLSVSSYIVGIKGLDYVPSQFQPFISEPACLDGLQAGDGGQLNRHIPVDALPNESTFLKYNQQ